MYRVGLIPIALTLFAFAALGFLSGPALAGHVILSGQHSPADIQSHCRAAGGSYYNSGGVYGCWGPGGDVTCSGKVQRCFGTCGNCGAREAGTGGKGVAGILKSPTFAYTSRPKRQSGPLKPF
jgi:hypothetical protein